MATINIGLDVGNYNTKTVHTSTASGFSECTKKPFFAEEYLYFNGKYYIPESERFPYLRDKTKNEHAFILSLFGIGKEILYRNRNGNSTNADEVLNKITSINLGIGVPPIHYSVLSNPTIEYYKERFQNGISFVCNNHEMHLALNNCICFAQDAAAVIGYVPPQNKKDPIVNYKSYYAVDIGGQTVDIITFINGKIDLDRCDSKPLGILVMYEKIIKRIEMETGKRISKDIIESVLRHEPTILDQNITTLIIQEADNWLNHIIAVLIQFGLDFDTYPVLFLGGGSLLFKPFINKLGLVKYDFINNPNANASGYEKMLKLSLKSQ